jgi:tetratricopeptide (TPR) repeat protein
MKWRKFKELSKLEKIITSLCYAALAVDISAGIYLLNEKKIDSKLTQLVDKHNLFDQTFEYTGDLILDSDYFALKANNFADSGDYSNALKYINKALVLDSTWAGYVEAKKIYSQPKHSLIKTNPVKKEDTFAHYKLNLESKYLGELCSLSEEGKNLLDTLLEKGKDNTTLKKIFNKQNIIEQDIKEVANEIYQLIYNEDIRFEEQFLFTLGLEEKKMDCDLLATIYKSIFEIHGVTSNIAKIPGHWFLRVPLDERKNYFNIECTSGIMLPTKDYLGKLVEPIFSDSYITTEEDLVIYTEEELRTKWTNISSLIWGRLDLIEKNKSTHK